MDKISNQELINEIDKAQDRLQELNIHLDSLYKEFDSRKSKAK